MSTNTAVDEIRMAGIAGVEPSHAGSAGQNIHMFRMNCWGKSAQAMLVISHGKCRSRQTSFKSEKAGNTHIPCIRNRHRIEPEYLPQCCIFRTLPAQVQSAAG